MLSLYHDRTMNAHTLHDCPCTGTPMGGTFNFESRNFPTKKVTTPATGTIEIDFGGAIDPAAHAMVAFSATGCYCLESTVLEICRPTGEEAIGIAGSPYPDMGAFLLDYFQSVWSLGSFTQWELVGAGTATKAKLKWTSTVDGLYPQFTAMLAGFGSAVDNGIVVTTVNDPAKKLECQKYDCGEPVGVDGCDGNYSPYTDAMKDKLLFVGIVQTDECGSTPCCEGAKCHCSKGTALTKGQTPLQFDPKVATSPGATNLVWDTMKRVYSLLTEAEVAAMPATAVVLTNHASFVRCCKTSPGMVIVSFG